MASRKKRLAFANYEEALARTEELAASGDQESEDFLAAAEAAAQFFLRDNDSYRFNEQSIHGKQVLGRHRKRKWFTINDLLCMADEEMARKMGTNFVIVERQDMSEGVPGDELD